MTTLTRSNAKALAATNTINFADLDDMDVVIPPNKATLAPPAIQPVAAPIPQSTEQRTMNTNTGIKYLGLAIAKASDPLHPNFVKALKPDTLLMYRHINQCAARAYDQHPNNPRAAIVATGKLLKTDLKAYIQFYKGLASDVAFAAHMDCIQFNRRSDPAALDAGLDAMMEEHPVTDDTPPFDTGTHAKDAEREAYSGSDAPEPVATSIADAYEAVEGAQAWIGLAVTNLAVEQQVYWGVDGLFPLGQRFDIGPDNQKVYSPLRDFDAYREWQDESFKAKRGTVALAPEVEDLMLNA